MGSKLSPGAYDCYSAAEPDEPMFFLLARDLTAEFLVAAWTSILAGDLDGALRVIRAAHAAWLASGKPLLEMTAPKSVEAQQCRAGAGVQRLRGRDVGCLTITTTSTFRPVPSAAPRWTANRAGTVTARAVFTRVWMTAAHASIPMTTSTRRARSATARAPTGSAPPCRTPMSRWHIRSEGRREQGARRHLVHESSRHH